jgi:hypothetical protein
MNDKVELLTKELEGVKTDQTTKVKEVISSTPSASVAAMIAQSLAASVSKETEVSKSEKLAKSKPNEAKEAALAPTGIPWIDAMITQQPNAQ